MTPDFTFDEKTGELQRGSIVMLLKEAHRLMFVALRSGARVPTQNLAEILEAPDKIWLANEVNRLRKRLRRIGLNIEGKKWIGYQLIVGEMPKWEPTIAPPVRLEGEAQ